MNDNDQSSDDGQMNDPSDLADIIKTAIPRYTEESEPDDPIEINSGHCRRFLEYLEENFELPAEAERIDAFDVHSWLSYDGKHYDAEHPTGVSDPHELALWPRLVDDHLKNAVAGTDCLTEDGFDRVLMDRKKREEVHTEGQTRCWSCQAFVADDVQDENGYDCPNCWDTPHAVELRDNGYTYDGTRWVKETDRPADRGDQRGD